MDKATTAVIGALSLVLAACEPTPWNGTEPLGSEAAPRVQVTWTADGVSSTDVEDVVVLGVPAASDGSCAAAVHVAVMTSPMRGFWVAADADAGDVEVDGALAASCAPASDGERDVFAALHVDLSDATKWTAQIETSTASGDLRSGQLTLTPEDPDLWKALLSSWDANRERAGVGTLGDRGTVTQGGVALCTTTPEGAGGDVQAP